MIQSIEIKNFKSIKSKFFKLKNLNVLLGLNGQGKSSFIQTLLLLRQSDKLYAGELKLNGGSYGYVDIGTTKDALYQYAKNEDLSFLLKFKDEDPFEMVFEYQIEADYFSEKKNNNKELEDFIKDNHQESLFSKNFQYLNANRIEPKSLHSKSYGNVVMQENIGNNGEYTAHYIEVHSNDEVAFENILHPKSKIVDEITNTVFINKTLINQINLWMDSVSPGVSVRITSVSSESVKLEFEFEQPNYGFTNRYKPENVGFGISYALHVVTALLSAKENELLIIENPESHIHPKGQAELGKLIALVAQNNVQIIVETHSDHIINGIRVAVKEGNLDKDNTIMFFFEKVITKIEQYSKITNIEIDKNGELSEYPKEMLEEWSNQLLKLI